MFHQSRIPQIYRTLVPPKEKMNKKIKLFTREGSILRLAKNISYALMKDGVCTVYMNDGYSYYCAMSLAEILKMFPRLGLHFIHQSTLINNNEISKHKKFDLWLITMKDGSKHEVSDRKNRVFVLLGITNWMELGQ
jgi:DNA-binding LytR/AlgR family response regulator